MADFFTGDEWQELCTIVTDNELVFTKEELMICDETDHYVSMKSGVTGTTGVAADKPSLGMKVHSGPFRRNEADSGKKMVNSQSTQGFKELSSGSTTASFFTSEETGDLHNVVLQTDDSGFYSNTSTSTVPCLQRVDTKLSSCDAGSDENETYGETMAPFDTPSPDQSVVSAGSDAFKPLTCEDSIQQQKQQSRSPPVSHEQPRPWSKRPSVNSTSKRIEKASKRGRSRKWSEEEDLKVKELVSKHGAGNWVRIATDLGSKTPKQIHARYRDYLRPGLVDSVDKPWTEDETRNLAMLHQKLGNSWSQLATLMPGRSANSIKNRVNAARRRRKSHAAGSGFQGIWAYLNAETPPASAVVQCK